MGRTELQKLLELKKEAKEKLFHQCWPTAKKSEVPLLMVYSSEKDFSREKLHQLLEGMLVLPMRVIVVSSMEASDHVKHPQGTITWINPEDGRNQPKIDQWLLASDMALVFDGEHKFIQHCFAKGVVPVGPGKSPFLMNYQPNEETGNSFTYNTLNPWDVFSAIVRAHETFRFPYDWQHIIRGTLKVR